MTNDDIFVKKIVFCNVKTTFSEIQGLNADNSAISFINHGFLWGTPFILIWDKVFFCNISNNFQDIELKVGTHAHHDLSYQLQLFEIDSHLIMRVRRRSILS
jgi:hypothetical protein